MGRPVASWCEREKRRRRAYTSRPGAAAKMSSTQRRPPGRSSARRPHPPPPRGSGAGISPSQTEPSMPPSRPAPFRSGSRFGNLARPDRHDLDTGAAHRFQFGAAVLRGPLVVPAGGRLRGSVGVGPQETVVLRRARHSDHHFPAPGSRKHTAGHPWMITWPPVPRQGQRALPLRELRQRRVPAQERDTPGHRSGQAGFLAGSAGGPAQAGCRVSQRARRDDRRHPERARCARLFVNGAAPAAKTSAAPGRRGCRTGAADDRAWS